MSKKRFAPGKNKPYTRQAPSDPTAVGEDVLALLRPGQSIELLKQLHILTRDGRLNQDSRRKLKQVDHLVRFIEDLVKSIKPYEDVITMADFGAGKSYLGFIVYDLLWRNSEQQAMVFGIETREDLVTRSAQLALALGFEHMRFLGIEAQKAASLEDLPKRLDLVTALHACDTATDDAIEFGLEKRAQAMALVPCCQAEVAACLRFGKAQNLSRTPLAELWRHPVHTREMGSMVTNVLRCLYLQSQGYEVTVTELVGWEHSLKNELILARRGLHHSASARQRMLDLIEELGLGQLTALRYRRVLE